jgi:hypothetical protein
MYTALYYPHSSLTNPELIKSALLLWDRVEYIKPNWYVGPHDPFWNASNEEKKQLSEAVELIGVGREPTKAEKNSVHEELEKLLESDLPDWIVFTPDNPNAIYSMFPDKLLPKTWDMLRHKGLAGLTPAFAHGQGFHDWSMHKTLGLLVMSLLAKACAGTQKMMITDESDAYATWTRCLTKETNGRYGKLDLADDVGPESQLLVTTSISVLSAKSINLQSLLKVRRREMEGKDTVLPTLRIKYYSEFKRFLDTLRECKTETDRTEIQRQFKHAMRLDVERLRRELKVEKRKVMWSNEMVAGLVFTAGTFLAPYLSSAIGIGELGINIAPVTGLLGASALVRTQIQFQEAERKTLESHPMSWLYVASKK